MKKQSILRLELLGALILFILANTVVKSMARNIVIAYWVNLMTTLFWIRRERQWKQYVTNRVKEIWQLTLRDLWRHCPGDLNPADLPFRGYLQTDYSAISYGGRDPFFLLPEDEWPCKVEPYDYNDIGCQELGKDVTEHTHYLALNSNSTLNLEGIFDCSCYSSLTRRAGY